MFGKSKRPILRPPMLRADGNYDVPLTRNLTAIVSPESLPVVSGWNWSADNNAYAYRADPDGNGGQRMVKMHRLILAHHLGIELAQDQYVDHINRNTLDCRVSNLRITKHSENMSNRKMQNNNTSGFVGVTRFAQDGSWGVQLKHDGKKIGFGYYTSREVAGAVFVVVSVLLRGEFATLEARESFDESLSIVRGYLRSPDKKPNKQLVPLLQERGIAW